MKPIILQFGVGAWGANHHRILSAMAATNEIAYTSVEVERGSYFAEVMRSVRPTAIVVATNSVNHFPIALHALAEGISVFCEKPIALSSSQVQTLQSTAVSTGALLAAGYQLLFDPLVAPLQHSCSAMVSIRSGAIPRDEGAVLSLAVHDIALAMWTLSRPVRSFKVEGAKHDALIELYYSHQPGACFAASIHVKSFSQVKTRHTIFTTDDGRVLGFTPDNWSRLDLLESELRAFVALISSDALSFPQFKLSFPVATATARIHEALVKGVASGPLL
jgi:predicted dehydrogenase